MADLIDRDALIAEYDRVHVGAPGGARKLMVDAPRVDAEPVRHGHWIIFTNKFTFGKCSICGMVQRAGWLNYCTECGAKMDEEEK